MPTCMNRFGGKFELNGGEFELNLKIGHGLSWHTCVVHIIIWNSRIFSGHFILVEHLLAVITCLSVAYDCNRGAPVLDSYFTNSFPQIFAHTDFTAWKGVLVQV